MQLVSHEGPNCLPVEKKMMLVAICLLLCVRYLTCQTDRMASLLTHTVQQRRNGFQKRYKLVVAGKGYDFMHCGASQGVECQGPTRGRQLTAGQYRPLGQVHKNRYIPHNRLTDAGPWTAFTNQTHLMSSAPQRAAHHLIYLPYQTDI